MIEFIFILLPVLCLIAYGLISAVNAENQRRVLDEYRNDCYSRRREEWLRQTRRPS